jgi:hypothetical protein
LFLRSLDDEHRVAVEGHIGAEDVNRAVFPFMSDPKDQDVIATPEVQVPQRVPDKGGGHVDDIHAIPLRELDGASRLYALLGIEKDQSQLGGIEQLAIVEVEDVPSANDPHQPAIFVYYWKLRQLRLGEALPRGPKQTEMLFDAGYHDARDQLGNVLESAGPAPKLYSQGRF